MGGVAEVVGAAAMEAAGGGGPAAAASVGDVAAAGPAAGGGGEKKSGPVCLPVATQCREAERDGRRWAVSGQTMAAVAD